MLALSFALLAATAVNAQAPAPKEFQLPPGFQVPKGVSGAFPKGLGSAGLNSLLLPMMAAGIPNGPAPKGCTDFEVLVARGTGEPGPFGVVVGDQIVNAVSKAIPGARGYAVQYPASLKMDSSSPTGTDDVIKRLNTQHAACPNQKFALVGYSQGAGVMHGVFAPTHPSYPGSDAVRPTLNPDVIPKILALVMFGDPGFRGGFGLGLIGGGNQFPDVLFGRLRQNCNKGDPVCDPATPAGFEKHLDYAQPQWQKASSEFIIDAFKGQPLPKSPRVPEDLGMILKSKGAPSPKVPRALMA